VVDTSYEEGEANGIVKGKIEIALKMKKMGDMVPGNLLKFGIRNLEFGTRDFP
jgi:hypothetical protein